MADPYRSMDGAGMLHDILRRLARLERGTTGNRVPEVLEAPEQYVNGAMFFVESGQLMVRVGDVSAPVATGGTGLQIVHTLPSLGGDGTAASPLYVVPEAPAPWISWSPQMKATTTDPTGYSAAGKYLVLNGMCFVEAQVIWGSSINRGDGSYQMTLPVAPASDYTSPSKTKLSGEITFGGSGYMAQGPIELGSTPLVNRMHFTDETGTGTIDTMTSTDPTTLASGDRITLTGFYRTS